MLQSRRSLKVLITTLLFSIILFHSFSNVLAQERLSRRYENYIWSEKGFSCTAVYYEPLPYFRGKVPFRAEYKIVNEKGKVMTTQILDSIKKNIYSYGDRRLLLRGIPTTVLALDKVTQRVVAEAKYIDVLTSNPNEEGVRYVTGYAIMEIHYDTKKKVIFRATSIIDHISGYKKSEKVIFGKKKFEPFFLWPVDSFFMEKVVDIAER